MVRRTRYRARRRSGGIGQINLAAEYCQSFALDNGAFTAWKAAGKNKIDWSDYKDPDFIAVVDTAFLGIKRVDPHFLTASRFQHINVAVS